jgi:phosphoribosyl 1,2-cyclic phosphodiesterase
VRVKLCGVRGSIAVPDTDKLRYGGNTACVLVELDEGALILDAGTGIRNLGAELYGRPGPLHILLSHLHLDHIMGLLFFAPFYDPNADVTVWGPAGGGHGLRRRLARYLSAPLSPIEIRDLPARVSFAEVPAAPWRLAGAEVRAGLVTHRGPTLGYRVDHAGSSLCYLPDHEPALGADLEGTPADWISGYALAERADLLIHDAQYTLEEYHTTVGWGHSTIADTLRFARRAQAERLLMFHHDPAHVDTQLDRLSVEAQATWAAAGGDPAQVAMAVEGTAVEL